VVEATGVPSHVGEREWLWNVEIRDGAGELCAMSSMAIAVRPAP
jgi:acyl-coenzyme A thioesterase PaaI-like protein